MIRIQYLDYNPDRSARVHIFNQFCKIYNNFISKCIGAYPFSVVIIDGILWKKYDFITIKCFICQFWPISKLKNLARELEKVILHVRNTTTYKIINVIKVITL